MLHFSLVLRGCTVIFFLPLGEMDLRTLTKKIIILFTQIIILTEASMVDRIMLEEDCEVRVDRSDVSPPLLGVLRGYCPTR